MLRILPALLLLAATAVAKEIDIPWERIALADGWLAVEGPRGMRDRFPYARLVAKGKQPEALTPELLVQRLEKPLATPEQAFEVVRTFVPGLVVPDRAAGERVLAVARALPANHGVKVVPYQPAAWGPSVARRGDGFTASLVALELDVGMRLTHFEVVIDADRKLTWKATPLARGMNVWRQHEGKPDAEAETARRARARDTMLKCAAALRPEPTRETAWVLTRTLATPAEIAAVIGEPDTGVHSKTEESFRWVLADESALILVTPRADDARKQPFSHAFRSVTVTRGDLRTFEAEQFAYR